MLNYVLLALFAVSFVLFYIVCAFSAGAIEFWYIGGWFVNEGDWAILWH